MKIVVMKFGGTSVADISKIKNVASIINKNYEKYKLVIVLSAMAGATNNLQKLIDQIDYPPSKENDLVLTSGEQITVGLLSMVLNKMKIKSMPLLGWQVPIITDSSYEKAKILNINKDNILKYLIEYDVVVLAGFQGINTEGKITSIGRGGSDTTAVAIASSLNAERCDIFSDVDGVYSSDPAIVKNAKKIDKISYEEMLEMSSMGAKVLHTRSVELAMKNNLTLQVLSSLTNQEGTFIVNEKKLIEKEVVRGVSYSKDESKITISGIPDKPGIAAKVFRILSRNKINIIEKMIKVSANSFGFNEIITPIFESSDLFSKPLGEQSDVVLKEMYTFNDRNNSSLTLRPEYTAPIIRAAISNNLLNKLPAKFFGIGPMFRRERPQKGRFREFYQMNFEIFGTNDALADTELILLASSILINILPNQQFKLHINSLGDRDTLKSFKLELSSFFSKYKNDLSEDSQSKINTNPLRILDSKNPKDIEISKDAPDITNLYSSNAKKKFEDVQALLNETNMSFVIDKALVRGLDYYCHTVFEFKNHNLGTQDTVIGGGRYDGLVKMIGGPDIPGVGWAGGIERLMLLMDLPRKNMIRNHLIVIDESLKNYGIKVLSILHENQIPIYWSYKYNLKKSLAFASDKKAEFVIIIGEEEYKNNRYTLKNLLDSSQETLSLEELIKKLS